MLFGLVNQAGYRRIKELNNGTFQRHLNYALLIELITKLVSKEGKIEDEFEAARKTTRSLRDHTQEAKFRLYRSAAET